MPERIDESKLSPIEKAELEIKIILQDMYVMGANDSEKSDIDSILIKMKSSEISPEEAIKQAMAIKNSKQDYH